MTSSGSTRASDRSPAPFPPAARPRTHELRTAATSRSTIIAAGAPAAIGPYSHAVAAGGGLLFVSGQTPIDPATGALVDGDFSAQARRVFDNLAVVLQGAGLSWAEVVKVNVFLVDMADFPAMNDVYASVLDAPHPARTTVAVSGLPLGARIEIELIASLPLS